MPELAADDYLKRFLYLSNHHVFIHGDPEPHLHHSPSDPTLKWASENEQNLQTFFDILTRAYNDALLVRRSNIFYILAKALRSQLFNNEQKLLIRNYVTKTIGNDNDLFDFVKYFTLAKADDSKSKISKVAKKIILNYYNNKTTANWVDSLIQQKSYHCWSHKDLIKLTHFKPKNSEVVPIVNYILFGDKKFEGLEETEAVLKLKKLHKLKTTENAAEAIQLIKELKAPINHVNSALFKIDDVWAAAVTVMSIKTLLESLAKMYKFKLLKANTKTFKTVVDILSKCKGADLHPLQWFMYRKLFQKRGNKCERKAGEKNVGKPEAGGHSTQPKDIKCKDIVKSISSNTVAASKKSSGSNKNILITIDPSQNQDKALKRKTTTFEVICSFLLYFLKVEKTVTFAVFKNAQIEIIDIKSTSSMSDILKTISKYSNDFIDPSAPIAWAKANNKPIDVFINFMNEDWRTKVPDDILQSYKDDHFTKYKDEKKVEHARLIEIYMESGPPPTELNNRRNVLVMNGFTIDAPRILEAFCSGKFC